MSDKTEMILVPRQPTSEMLNGVCMHPDLVRSLWAGLLKNAPKPDCSPVAWTWIGALDQLKGYCPDGVSVFQNESPGTPVALYTHADPVSVDRLIAQCVEKDARIAEMDRIGSAKLDEAHALLREISNWLVCEPIATPEDMAQSFTPFREEIDKLLGVPAIHGPVTPAKPLSPDELQLLKGTAQGLGVTYEKFAKDLADNSVTGKCKDCGQKLGHDDDAWDQCRFCNAGKPTDEANTRGAAMGKPE